MLASFHHEVSQRCTKGFFLRDTPCTSWLRISWIGDHAGEGAGSSHCRGAQIHFRLRIAHASFEVTVCGGECHLAIAQRAGRRRLLCHRRRNPFLLRTMHRPLIGKKSCLERQSKTRSPALEEWERSTSASRSSVISAPHRPSRRWCEAAATAPFLDRLVVRVQQQ